MSLLRKMFSLKFSSVWNLRKSGIAVLYPSQFLWVKKIIQEICFDLHQEQKMLHLVPYNFLVNLRWDPKILSESSWLNPCFWKFSLQLPGMKFKVTLISVEEWFVCLFQQLWRQQLRSLNGWSTDISSRRQNQNWVGHARAISIRRQFSTNIFPVLWTQWRSEATHMLVHLSILLAEHLLPRLGCLGLETQREVLFSVASGGNQIQHWAVPDP